MALNSIITKVGDGTTNQFSVAFTGGYMDQSNIRCRVGTEAASDGSPVYRTPLRFIAGGLIEVPGAPAGTGVTVRFERITPMTTPVNDFKNGTVLDEKALDDGFKQTVFGIQELQDAYGTAGSAENWADKAKASADLIKGDRAATEAAAAAAAENERLSGLNAGAAHAAQAAADAAQGTANTALANTLLPHMTQNRWRCNYYTGTKLQIFGGGRVSMDGFRMFGNYYGAGRSLTTGVQGFTTVDTADGNTDLGAETVRKRHSWYAVFAVANASDTSCKFRLMPYLRVRSVSGGVVTLGEAGESQPSTPPAATYSWRGAGLTNVACLVITQDGKWSGRVTQVTATTATTVTLASAGSLGPGDFLLPAPPGFTEYAWLVDHYMDAAEWRNVADTCIDTGSFMVSVDVSATGALTSATEVSFAGFISPLATQVRTTLTYSLSTSGSGAIAYYFWHDASSHMFWSCYDTKRSSVSDTYEHSGIQIPFSIRQSVWIKTEGAIHTAVTGRSLGVRGWTVP